MSLFGNLFEMTETGDRSAAGQVSLAERWSGVAAVPQQREDRLPYEEALAKWSRIYELFGASSESSMDEAFAAVNLYFLVNGASPSGRYARTVRTAGGTSVAVDSIVKITGKLEGEIRQFLRSDMNKTYYCLKLSPAIKADRALQDKAERLGVPRTSAWLLADWLRDCEYLTGEEAAIHGALSVKLINDANARRRAPVASHRIERDVVEADEPSASGGMATPLGFAGSSY